MSIVTGMLGRGRSLAENLMDSSVVIRRKTGAARDPETGTLIPTWETVYDGPARFRFTRADPNEADQAGQRVAVQSPLVWLPISTSGGVRLDDVGTVNASQFDTSMVGMQFRITGGHHQTHSTSRRLPIEVLSYAQGVDGG
ncbi:hypothetical protein GCM10010910_01330 [Microbacterium nanhaiense]|uniref:Uncharacterized protein n=1 Tax=Microbacterium nanhaiense TaxID=1301026 RepID=A0ABQ2MUX0_9MICO|nr:DUF6093 family protein [Microbacterium nanhaiense]GGO59119.1 hypothetical protein GCM10010910_01330 [Microbacterium nanhaiense]